MEWSGWGCWGVAGKARRENPVDTHIGYLTRGCCVKCQNLFANQSQTGTRTSVDTDTNTNTDTDTLEGTQPVTVLSKYEFPPSSHKI